MEDTTLKKEKLFTPRFIATLIVTALVTVVVTLALFFAWELFYVKPFVKEFEAELHIVLSADSTLNGEDVLFTEGELADRESPYAAYRSSMLYDSLSNSEKLVYRAMEYALEESLPYVCVDRRLITEEEALKDVLRCLALDSPLLEQNLRYGTQEFSVNYPLPTWNIYTMRATFEGYYIRVYNFDETLWQKKMTAVEEAKAIVARLPKELDVEERSVELYRCIAQGAEYLDYPDSENTVQSFLYDALLAGKTNCDGYTNALALVYRLAGIECVEKTYNGDAKKDEAGHTWLSFCLDGEWYNADPTGRSAIPETVTAMKGGLYYGYADILQRHVPIFADRYPKCERGLAIEVDAHIATTADPSLTQTFLDGFNKHNRQWTLVLADAATKEQVQTHVQAVANKLRCNVTTRYVELIEGRTAIFLYTAL